MSAAEPVPSVALRLDRNPRPVCYRAAGRDGERSVTGSAVATLLCTFKGVRLFFVGHYCMYCTYSTFISAPLPMLANKKYTPLAVTCSFICASKCVRTSLLCSRTKHAPLAVSGSSLCVSRLLALRSVVHCMSGCVVDAPLVSLAGLLHYALRSQTTRLVATLGRMPRRHSLWGHPGATFAARPRKPRCTQYITSSCCVLHLWCGFVRPTPPTL